MAESREADMDDVQEQPTRGVTWHKVLTIVLGIGVAVVLVSLLAGGPLSAFSYVAGLCNSLFLFSLVPLLVLLVLAAFVVLPVLLVRTVWIWSRQTEHGRRANLLILAGLTAATVPTALNLVGFGRPLFEPFMRGFTIYAERKANVPAMQQWLRSLDANDYKEELAGVQARPIEGSEQPPVVAQLHPKKARLMSDGQGRLMVELLWGGGFIGHWGVRVGVPDMDMPEDLPYYYAEPLAPGAYVWGGD